MENGDLVKRIGTVNWQTLFILMCLVGGWIIMDARTNQHFLDMEEHMERRLDNIEAVQHQHQQSIVALQITEAKVLQQLEHLNETLDEIKEIIIERKMASAGE